MSASGFEPETVCLEGRCSIQLSYAPEVFKKVSLETVPIKIGMLNLAELRTLIFLKFSIFLSGWQDSNLRPPGPKPGAMTGLRYTPNFLVAEGKGFEPLRPLRVDSLANCSVNHSGNPPCKFFKNFYSVIASANIKRFY